MTLNREICVCGKPLQGLAVTGQHRFTFIPSSSLSHYNFELPFDRGVHLTGGRVFEQCESCGALTLCEYPLCDGEERGDDPLITYGPGTVYEQCDLASVPTTYRSFRALMTSGVTGGIMYSGVFRNNLAELYHTTSDDLPSWKVVKDAMLDSTNVTLDEWWSASIGRNFIVLYENTKVLRPLAAWHRIPGTEPKNERIERIRALNTDPLAKFASDTEEVVETSDGSDTSNDRRRLMIEGNRARTRLLKSSLQVGRALPDLPQWMPPEVLKEGGMLFNAHHVIQVDETAYGIWHGLVSDPLMKYDAQVDILVRHNSVSRITCSCEAAQHKHLCKHMTAVLFEIGRRFQFRVQAGEDYAVHGVGPASPVGDIATMHHYATVRENTDRYRHYADAISLIHNTTSHEQHYRTLTTFIEPIEHATEPLYHIEFMATDPAGKHRVGFCVYSKVILTFIETVLNLTFVDYQKVMSKYGLDSNVHIDILNIDTLNGDLVEALLILMVRKERACEGVLAEALENGILLKLLKRLATIDNGR